MTWLAVASVGIPVLCGMSALLAWWARDRRSPPAVDRHPLAASRLARENSLAQAEADGTPVTVDGITTTGKSNCAEKCREHKVKEKVAKEQD